MEITDIRIRLVNTSTKMKAVASVTFDNELVVHDIKVIDSGDKYIIGMPSRKLPDETFKDIVHPINQEARTKLQEAIIRKYETLITTD